MWGINVPQEVCAAFGGAEAVRAAVRVQVESELTDGWVVAHERFDQYHQWVSNDSDAPPLPNGFGVVYSLHRSDTDHPFEIDVPRKLLGTSRGALRLDVRRWAILNSISRLRVVQRWRPCETWPDGLRTAAVIAFASRDDAALFRVSWL